MTRSVPGKKGDFKGYIEMTCVCLLKLMPLFSVGTTGGWNCAVNPYYEHVLFGNKSPLSEGYKLKSSKKL